MIKDEKIFLNSNFDDIDLYLFKSEMENNGWIVVEHNDMDFTHIIIYESEIDQDLGRPTCEVIDCNFEKAFLGSLVKIQEMYKRIHRKKYW
jgi:hypothetical protein